MTLVGTVAVGVNLDEAIEAAVVLHLIAVVALFNTSKDDAITTARTLTATQTGISLVVIAVIACFITLISLSQISAHYPIAAASRRTGIEAPIIVSRITVVTSFT